ncbi:transcriptional regulator, IclR family [Catenulispora acidiphila DSM 44928]|uniref:Glycerol operon regulatory protein n=1 Tax=Catenulispora acidiphila (strain DSM 44928 / JCM 14897 / NBRC 102108 / NRRL B-24433 / ID139908) TaxID=479433 RepID=C7QB51_CATAD|nr:IclR family transcriptional regulator [Catenulispora acidiphila]ACU76342.1 transcriptional regulator, IclR family [Catenulispora acidiphila DSM 44928]
MADIGITSGPAVGSAATTKDGALDGTGGDSAGVKSARRAVELLEAFGSNHSWLSLTDLHHLTGFPRSSLHGLLRTLRDVGWIESDDAGTRFRLGVKALICGTAYLDRDPVMPYATEALEKIRDQIGYTCHFARLNGPDIVYLQTRESRTSAHLVSRVGRTLPAHATALGKVLLAELADDELTGVLPKHLTALTDLTITDREALRSELAFIRERGYSTERGQSSPNLACVAAVVPYRIPGTDAMSCSMPGERVTDAELQRVGALLRDVAEDLSQQLRRAGIR